MGALVGEPNVRDPLTSGMQRISRVDNRLTKVLAPVLMGEVCLGTIAAMASRDGLPWLQVAPILAVFATAIGWLGWRLQRQMADEVWDDGERLLVRRSGIDISLPLTEIIKVESRGLRHSTTVSLHLRDGGKILFCPRVNPPASYYFAGNLVADDLSRRVLTTNEKATRS